MNRVSVRRPLPRCAWPVGWWGARRGKGFYRYVDGQKQGPAEPPAPALPSRLKVWVSGIHPQGHTAVAALLDQLGVERASDSRAPDDALIVVTPYGEDVSTAVFTQDLDPARTVGLDALHGFDPKRRRTVMASPATLPQWRDAAQALFASDGAPVSVIEDSPGFVAQRIVATIINIACDIAQQRIATAQDIDKAVTLGLGYPMGPLAMGDVLGAGRILEILRNMQRVTGDPRYRPSLWLQRRVQLKMSLLEG